MDDKGDCLRLTHLPTGISVTYDPLPDIMIYGNSMEMCKVKAIMKLLEAVDEKR